MGLASHNSWSYLPPKKWWMRVLGFTSKCQDVDIDEQYEKYGVRCFDLRLKFKNGEPIVVHNKIEYDITEEQLWDILRWLDHKGDVAIRVLLDIRNKKDYTQEQRDKFVSTCTKYEKTFPNIKFWGGKNIYNEMAEYVFKYKPSCEGRYASVRPPYLIDDLYPRAYAKKYNKKMIEKGTNKDWLMLDFVNYL